MTTAVQSPTAAAASVGQAIAPSRRNLRILVVTDVFPALSETFILDQLVSFLQAGHEVRVIADRPRQEQVMHPEVAQYGLLTRTHYLNVPQHRRARVGVLLRAIGAGGPRVVASFADLLLARLRIHEPGNLSMLAATIVALVDAGEVDVVVCHFGENGARLVRATGALGRDVPVLTIFHGFDLTRLIRTHGPRCYGNLRRGGRLFLPTSEAFADRLRAMDFPDDRIVVQRMCVDLDKLDAVVAALPPGPGPNGPFTFLGVGRLVEKKGFRDAVRAFAQAFGTTPPGSACLRIVGGGPMREELEALAASTGVTDRVTFLGPLQRQRVLAEMRGADALVQPSVTAADGDMEGLPVVISEGMALRKPVITTRHSGIPELVIDEVTGRLVAEADVPSLAAAMSWMAAHQDAARRMGEAGRARLEGGFNAAFWNGALERVLQKAVSQHAA